jgi:GTPase SAR1 family protein
VGDACTRRDLRLTPGISRLRPLSYPDLHVILICFAINSRDSLDKVQE